MMIKDLGSNVVTAWEGLRPVTKKLVVRALNGGSTNGTAARSIYDAHADWELSRLLTALDEQGSKLKGKAKDDKLSEISELAEICVKLLQAQSASAEVYIQLAERALKRHDFNGFDKLSDLLFERFSAAEIAEIIRQAQLPHIRAVAFETLMLLPVNALTPLLNDSLYAEIALNALEQKAFEYESDEARDALEQLDAEAFFNAL